MTDCWCRHKTVCSTAHSPPSSLLQILHSTSYAIQPQGCTHRDCLSTTITTTTTDAKRNEAAAQLELDSIMEGSVSWLELLKRAHVAKVESDSIIRGKYPHFLPHHSLTQHPITKNKTKNQESARSNIRPAPYQWKARIHYKYKSSQSKFACLYWYHSKWEVTD